LGPFIRIRTEVGEEGLDLEEFEGRVRRGELAAHCPVCFPAITGETWVRADSLDLYRRLCQPRQLYFTRAFNLGRFPKLTALFIIAEVTLYLVMSADGPPDQDGLILYGAKVVPLMLDTGQYWRLLTANLLHKDALHIAFNLFVLFNVGGALENVFRGVDYLLILYASALGTTVASVVALPDAVTAGASGMVYGSLGAAVVFGVKYRELLPSRYRRILGEAIIPTVLVFLYIGFTSSGVDNFAHIGGLSAGSVTALFLKPRLLREKPATPGGVLAAASPMVFSAAGIIGLSLLGERLPVPTQVARDDAFGIEAEVPRTWWRGADRFGQIAYYNGLSGVGRASFTAQAQLRAPGLPLASAVDEFLKRQLLPEERAGVLKEVALASPVAVRVADREGLLLSGSFRDEGNATQVRAYFVSRGELLYELVFQWHAEYPAYERLLTRLVERVRFLEPRALREARARVLLDPSGAAGLNVLGETLRRLGHWEGAASVLARAVMLAPSDAEAVARLAQLLLSQGKVAQGCRKAEEALALRPDAMALEAMADCRTQENDPLGALGFLRRAIVAAPGSERLAAKIRSLAGRGDPAGLP
jgi:membrane associated rhomboid family serine protease